MDTPRLPDTALAKPNKLIIRSEVLAVIRHLSSVNNPPLHEVQKQVKRLNDLHQPLLVQESLIKELQRNPSAPILGVLIQLLMEIGDIDTAQAPLWSIIQDPATKDEIKDAANLVLRHLGDSSDPDLYLAYMDDPEGLINRETLRMLEISAENPEALIDFIDFILSLNTTEQRRLLEALQQEYPSDYLVNLFIPLLESDPAPELWEQLVMNLGESRSVKASEYLQQLAQWPEDRLPVSQKLLSKALAQLKLAGLSAFSQEKPLSNAASHSLVQTSTPYEAYVTLSDGLGNQGVLFSRKRSNGDIVLLSAAINDVHGIIDCFGFSQLAAGDFNRLLEKFHEGATQIKVSSAYAAYKLSQAEACNRSQAYRLPYEYGCWRVILEDIDITSFANFDVAISADIQAWGKPEWFLETANLYEHPDFKSWFLEQGDTAAVTSLLQQVVMLTEAYLIEDSQDWAECLAQLDLFVDKLVHTLLQTEWRSLIQHRLAEAAYLLHQQETYTFRDLAATEALKLQAPSLATEKPTGFLQAYGRRCITEELLRLRSGSAHYDRLTPLVNTVFDHWKM